MLPIQEWEGKQFVPCICSIKLGVIISARAYSDVKVTVCHCFSLAFKPYLTLVIDTSRSYCWLHIFFLCRRIENPRIVLLDCSLEYKKGESQVPCTTLVYICVIWWMFLNIGVDVKILYAQHTAFLTESNTTYWL